MITTGAGPEGVMPAGSVILVADELAERLAAGGYAELMDAAPAPVIETASMEPAAERAVAPAQRKRRRRKSSGKAKEFPGSEGE